MVRDALDKKYGTDLDIPVVFYRQLIALAFGLDAKKDTALNRNTIQSEKLEKKAKTGG